MEDRDERGERHLDAEYAAAFMAAASHGPRWPQGLTALLDDGSVPAKVRASAIEALTRAHPRHLLARFMNLIEDRNPLVRRATVEASAILLPQDRVQVAGPTLTDGVREVRLASGRVLVGAEEELSSERAPHFVTARNEWIEHQREQAESPESWLRLATLYAVLGRGDDAERSLRRALELDPDRVSAWVTLVELYEATGRPEEAEATLDTCLSRWPEAPALVHARGLAHIRAGRGEAALQDLRRAVQLDPEQPRYAYVYVVALMDLSGDAQALGGIEAALARHPRDPELLRLAVALYERSGDPSAAMAAARTLEESDPGDPGYQALVLQFGARE